MLLFAHPTTSVLIQLAGSASSQVSFMIAKRNELRMKKKIIKFYGLETYGAEGEDEEVSAEEFRVSFCNLNLTIKDGVPAQIPTLEFLYVGSIGSAYNSEKLKQAGITHILCLSESIRLNFPYQFAYLRVPMVDQPEYNFADDLAQIFTFIENAKEEGGRVLVHCYQGKSRSCAVCCAYLIRYENHSLSSALELVRQARSIAAPNSGFMAALEALELENNNTQPNLNMDSSETTDLTNQVP